MIASLTGSGVRDSIHGSMKWITVGQMLPSDQIFCLCNSLWGSKRRFFCGASRCKTNQSSPYLSTRWKCCVWDLLTPTVVVNGLVLIYRQVALCGIPKQASYGFNRHPTNWHSIARAGKVGPLPELWAGEIGFPGLA